MAGGVPRALCVICVLTAGCSSSSGGLQTAPATGVVTYKGAPVPGAVVVFQPASDEGSTKPAQTQTGDGGAFSMQTLSNGTQLQDGVMPGEYLVSIRKIEAPADFTGPPREVLPRKYGNAKSSGLKASVKNAGENKFEFKLSD